MWWMIEHGIIPILLPLVHSLSRFVASCCQDVTQRGSCTRIRHALTHRWAEKSLARLRMVSIFYRLHQEPARVFGNLRTFPIRQQPALQESETL